MLRRTEFLVIFAFQLYTSYISALTYTYPVKSINLELAFQPSFYVGHNAETDGWTSVMDLHAVHGIATTDGGHVLVGIGLESEGSTSIEAFAVKLSTEGQLMWSWTSNHGGNDDAANSVAEIDGSVIVVGWRQVGSVGQRCITKLDLLSGTEIWTATDFGDATGSHGAYEMINIDGTSAYLSGTFQVPTLDEMWFKSYGNVAGGSAFVQKIPLSAFSTADPVDTNSLIWEQSFGSSFFTAKTAEVLSNQGRVAILMYGEGDDSANHAAVAMLEESSGEIVWGPRTYGNEHGEATDMKVAIDEETLIIVGHGAPTEGTLAGRVSQITTLEGSLLWTKDFTVGGNPNLIFNECWGAIALTDGSGFIVSCGAGIETCDGLTGQDKVDCNNGYGDPRPGALLRGAENWQSFIFMINASGELQWQRVDSYRCEAVDDPACAPMDDQNFDVANLGSSAAEWIFQNNEGDVVVVTDEVFGFGLLKLINTAASFATQRATSTMTINSMTTTTINAASTTACNFSIFSLI